VLVHRCYDFEKPHVFTATAAKVLGDGILFAEGDVHKQQRKSLNPAFGFRHIKGLYPMFWDRSLRLIKALEEQGEHTDSDSDKYITVEVQEWANKATLSIIEEAALGIDTNIIEDPKEPLTLTYRTLLNPGKLSKVIQFLGLFFPAWLIQNIPTPLNRAVKRNTSIIMDITAAQKELIESPEQDMNIHPNTVIATLVKSEQFSLPELMEQMRFVLLAGHETTATALTWAIYLLTQHPDMQKRQVCPFLPSTLCMATLRAHVSPSQADTS
jgi:cytochrome P450